MILTLPFHDDEPVIHVAGGNVRALDYSWSDFPLLQEEYLTSKNSFKRDFADVILREASSANLSPPCALEFSSMSWSDLILPGMESSSTLEDDDKCKASTTAVAASRKRKAVSFHQLVEIRYHKLTIGDHPFCTDSLPISLDWDHAETVYREVDELEAERKGFPSQLSYYEKKNILRNISGLKESDMKIQEEPFSLRHSSKCLRNLSLALGNCT